MIACGGKKGPQGDRGPQGPPGPAPTFTGASFSLRGMELQTNVGGVVSLFKTIKVDPRSFTIKFVASDDSSLTIDLSPMFREYDEQKKP
jgi:hypothetical protein